MTRITLTPRKLPNMAIAMDFKTGDRIWFLGHTGRGLPAQTVTVICYRMSGDLLVTLGYGYDLALGLSYFRRSR